MNWNDKLLLTASLVTAVAFIWAVNLGIKLWM